MNFYLCGRLSMWGANETWKHENNFFSDQKKIFCTYATWWLLHYYCVLYLFLLSSINELWWLSRGKYGAFPPPMKPKAYFVSDTYISFIGSIHNSGIDYIICALISHIYKWVFFIFYSPILLVLLFMHFFLLESHLTLLSGIAPGCAWGTIWNVDRTQVGCVQDKRPTHCTIGYCSSPVSQFH